MIACVYCGRDVESNIGGGIVVSSDSDLACSKECAEKYKYDWEHFKGASRTDVQKFAVGLGGSYTFCK
jgi:hypothetical protein